jgi:hypothetical protein
MSDMNKSFADLKYEINGLENAIINLENYIEHLEASNLVKAKRIKELENV